MIYLLKYWRELIIAALVLLLCVLSLKLQSANYEAKEIKLIHEKLVNDAELKTANIVATAQRQRQLEAEKYAVEINSINERYNDALAKSNRVQQEVTTYNTRLHTATREAVENYAKTGSVLYGECRKEYLNLGQYTAKLDAELDKVAKSPQ